MRRYYNVDDNDWSNTNCPNATFLVRVGSIYCRNCKHHDGQNCIEHYVDCSCPQEKVFSVLPMVDEKCYFYDKGFCKKGLEGTECDLNGCVAHMTREEIISLSGQVVNGMLSADSSVIAKVIDRTMHKQIAASAVDVAIEMLREVDQEGLLKLNSVKNLEV